MIAFFRTIRRGLLQQKSISKYIGYAFGEILLVVIGILIALQINNWNAHQKAVLVSKNYLNEFKKDLVSDRSKLEGSLRGLQLVLDVEQWVLNRTKYTTADADSILSATTGINFVLSINDRTFVNIQNSGNSKLEGYDALFTQLSHYYIYTNEKVSTATNWDKQTVNQGQAYMSTLYQSIEKDYKYVKRFTSSITIPEFPRITKPTSQHKIIIDFATSVQGRNHFNDNYMRHLYLKGVFRSAFEESSVLIALIDEALAK